MRRDEAGSGARYYAVGEDQFSSVAGRYLVLTFDQELEVARRVRERTRREPRCKPLPISRKDALAGLLSTHSNSAGLECRSKHCLLMLGCLHQ